MLYIQATHRPRTYIAEETSEYADLLSERERLLRRLEIIDFWLRVKKTPTCWIWTGSVTRQRQALEVCIDTAHKSGTISLPCMDTERSIT